MNILMISPVNYAPENLDGIKKILYNIIKRNDHWIVDFLSFSDVENNSILRNVTNYFVENKQQSFSLSNILRYPYALKNYNFNAIENKLAQMLLNKEYDIVIVVSSVMAKLIDIIPESFKSKTILLSIDSMSLFWQRRVDSSDSFKKMIYRWQLTRWRYYERKYHSKFSKVIFVSEVDQAYYNKWNNNSIVIENGVDINRFYFPAESTIEPYSIIFTGNMNYLPNRNAALYLLKDIYPLLIKELEFLKLYIVGIGAGQLKSLCSAPNIVYKDYVDDISEYLLKAQVYVSPLMQGSGIKNKILEAMATGRLIVGSPISFDGIHGIQEGDVCIAVDKLEYVKYIKQYFDENEENNLPIQKRLADLIKERYSWESVAQKYNKTFLLEMKK